MYKISNVYELKTEVMKFCIFREDLELGYGGCVTVISDGHKGLIEAVAGILPDSEHRQCARHIYANFKRKWSGLQYKRLFWGASSCTVDQQFLLKTEEIKELDPTAYKWLVERNPNSWCRAFSEMNRCSTTFENGISESFNARIVPARGKPIITMLEDIRIYVMQRMYHMNELSFKLEDTITPSVRKRLEYLKEKQSWLVYPSGFREVEVRRRDYAYGVNLHTKHCGCRFWELSGIPCIHAMAAYYHMKMEPGIGEDDNHVTRLGRVMHCHTCWEVGHNKKGCQNQSRPKPLGLATTIGKPPHILTNSKGKGIDTGTKKEEYQHKMDMEALAEENMAKEFRDDELNRPEDSLEAAYSFDTILEIKDDELNVHQVSMDLPVNEAPENCTTKESQVQDPDPKPTIPIQESQVQTRSKIRKQVAATTSMRFYVKNRGKYERIANIKAKNFKFDANGSGSTADKAFDVSEDED
ncbi:hypothetical protein Tco_0441253 [Tanacetum coccineum]